MYKKNLLGLDEARVAVDSALKAARMDTNRPVAIAVVDFHGDLVCFAKMDGALPVCTSIAINKAYTSALTSLDTSTFAERDEKLGRELATYGDGRFTYIRGGVCIPNPFKGKKLELLGGIGVSGRTPEEDEKLAAAGLQAMKLTLRKR